MRNRTNRCSQCPRSGSNTNTAFNGVDDVKATEAHRGSGLGQMTHSEADRAEEREGDSRRPLADERNTSLARLRRVLDMHSPLATLTKEHTPERHAYHARCRYCLGHEQTSSSVNAVPCVLEPVRSLDGQREGNIRSGAPSAVWETAEKLHASWGFGRGLCTAKRVPDVEECWQ